MAGGRSSTVTQPEVTVHPDEERYAADANAFPYAPRLGDPLPGRPREVICELMFFGVPLAENTHFELPYFSLTAKMFVGATRGLVAEARQGHIDDHIAEARSSNIIRQVGNVGALQLYTWGMATKSKAYRKRNAARIALAELTTGSALEVVDPSVIAKLMSTYRAARSRLIFEGEARILDLLLEVERAREALGHDVLACDLAWAPVSTVPQLDDITITNRCWQKRLEATVHTKVPAKTDRTLAKARRSYESEVLREHVLALYKDENRAKELHEFTESRITAHSEAGGTEAAWRCGRLLHEASLAPVPAASPTGYQTPTQADNGASKQVSPLAKKRKSSSNARERKFYRHAKKRKSSRNESNIQE